MKDHVVTVIFKCKPEKAQLMETSIKGVYQASLHEKGCQEYRWYKSTLNETDYLLFMTWASEDCFVAHVNSPHIQQVEEELKDILRAPAPELLWEFKDSE